MGLRRVLTVFHWPQVRSTYHRINLDGGWQPTVVEGVAQAKELIAREHFCVGLIAFDARGECALDNGLADLLALPTMRWIALVSKELLADANRASRLRRLITTLCFDFHTLPVDGPRLTAALGHAYGMAQLAVTEGNPPREPVGAFSRGAGRHSGGFARVQPQRVTSGPLPRDLLPPCSLSADHKT